MLTLLIALALVVGGLWVMRKFANASPRQAAILTRKIGGAACVAVAGFIALRGGIVVAVPLAVFGAGLMGYSGLFPAGFTWGRKSTGQRSRVSTSVLAMELDHDTGRMDGKILAGEFAGRRLSVLSESELKSLYSLCSAAPDQSRSLFEAWLDRSKPEWRRMWQTQSGSHRKPSARSAMSREEAIAILGLKPDTVTPEAVRKAHRRLMKQFHPDTGGSDYLAARINQAKDVLRQD